MEKKKIIARDDLLKDYHALVKHRVVDTWNLGPPEDRDAPAVIEERGVKRRRRNDRISFETNEETWEKLFVEPLPEEKPRARRSPPPPPPRKGMAGVVFAARDSAPLVIIRAQDGTQMSAVLRDPSLGQPVPRPPVPPQEAVRARRNKRRREEHSSANQTPSPNSAAPEPTAEELALVFGQVPRLPVPPQGAVGAGGNKRRREEHTHSSVPEPTAEELALVLGTAAGRAAPIATRNPEWGVRTPTEQARYEQAQQYDEIHIEILFSRIRRGPRNGRM